MARIEIGKRDVSKKSLYGTQIGLLVTGVIFFSDLIIYLIRKNNGHAGVVDLVLFIISAVLFGLSLIGLLFSYSNYRANKKSAGRPLLAFDEEKDAFIVYDLSFNEERIIPNGNLLDIAFNGEELGDVTIHYLSDKNKKEFADIGIASKSQEVEVKNKINQYSKNKLL